MSVHTVVRDILRLLNHENVTPPPKVFYSIYDHYHYKLWDNKNTNMNTYYDFTIWRDKQIGEKLPG
jgi:hypothetical protein